MADLAKIFAEFGPNVALVIALLYWVFFLQRKIISIIENNTEIMTKSTAILEEIKQVMERCRWEGR
jgi:hypothetical protein